MIERYPEIHHRYQIGLVKALANIHLEVLRKPGANWKFGIFVDIVHVVCIATVACT
jgi:hypothetical protein